MANAVAAFGAWRRTGSSDDDVGDVCRHGLWAVLEHGSHHRDDLIAVLDRDRAANLERKGADEKRWGASELFSSAFPRHSLHSDAGDHSASRIPRSCQSDGGRRR